MVWISSVERTHVDKMAGNGGGRCHGWADQVSTTTLPLTSFKVTVGGRSATLARFQTVGIHGQTHGATRRTPLKSGAQENLVQTFLFGLTFHQTGAWNNHGLLDVGRHFATLGHAG